jgi:hypothetical protein
MVRATVRSRNVRAMTCPESSPKFTAVTDDRLSPLTVTAMVVPGAPDEGVTEVIAGKTTANPSMGTVAPECVVRNIVRGPGVALGAMVT